jgi:CRP-like cAMP-binding protein
LKDKERKLLCQEADFQVTPENDVLMTVGETVSAIHVVVKGECAIYTMRPDPQKIMAKVASADPKHPMVQQQIDLKSKFESMQRRAAVSIRTGSSSDSANGKVPKTKTAAQCRQSVAMAVGTGVETGTEQQDTLHNLKKPAHQQSRRGSIAVRRDSFAVAPARRNSLAVGSSANLPKDGTLFPIQMVFEEGDALGVQRAIHNNTPELVQKQGYLFADHTVMALSEVTTMTFTKPEHIEMIARAYHTNLEEKVKLLSKVPSYAQYPQGSLRSMAKFCRRLWYKSGECVVNQGDEAEHVLYISAGQCRIVKDLGAPEERTLCVLRRAACMGDCAFFDPTTLYFPRTKPQVFVPHA